ncbi:CDP-alcohol phosphatidyltransferase family protein [Sulfurospirillum cavolei]|uniref:CDP-alcohol phosphatidyltransferase family protein n=1 Tax=Sulfurospirillum cavolei TaxID=366522 RepID=UPI0005A84680|nr:CDP-alcohol phosphatidyltransferase family protein [Sulfurospirillum cavolei]
MPTIYDLKPAFQSVLRPIVRVLANRGITANQITLAALGLSVVWGGLIALTQGALWTLWMLPVVLFVRMALNAIDGMLAKEHDMKSDLGAMLNEMGDVLSDTALYLPFAMIEGVSPLWVTLFVIVAILTEMAGILGAVIGKTRRYDGPMGKSDRAFVIGSTALVLGLGMTPYLWVNGVLMIATILASWTVLRRCQKGLV